jgi:transcription initiation factor TFIIIB Brf1 subunit/transcription initiation factor TFIIB
MYPADRTEHTMYRARDHVENEEWLAAIDDAAERLDLDTEAKSRAIDLFLSTVTQGDEDRSKRATVAGSLYAGALIAGDRRSQSAVADAADVSRLTVQQRWKDLLAEAGLEPPTW